MHMGHNNYEYKYSMPSTVTRKTPRKKELGERSWGEYKCATLHRDTR